MYVKYRILEAMCEVCVRGPGQHLHRVAQKAARATPSSNSARHSGSLPGFHFPQSAAVHG